MEPHLYFAHSGIKGMKWGVRRFRNEDGTLTEAAYLIRQSLRLHLPRPFQQEWHQLVQRLAETAGVLLAR